MIFGNEIAQTRNYLAADSVRTRGVKWGLSLDMVGEDTEKTGGTVLIEIGVVIVSRKCRTPRCCAHSKKKKIRKKPIATKPKTEIPRILDMSIALVFRPVLYCRFTLRCVFFACCSDTTQLFLSVFKLQSPLHTINTFSFESNKTQAAMFHSTLVAAMALSVVLVLASSVHVAEAKAAGVADWYQDKPYKNSKSKTCKEHGKDCKSKSKDHGKSKSKEHGKSKSKKTTECPTTTCKPTYTECPTTTCKPTTCPTTTECEPWTTECPTDKAHDAVGGNGRPSHSSAAGVQIGAAVAGIVVAVAAASSALMLH